MPKPTKNIESIYTLSPMQEGMLFHTLYAPESGVYFDQFNFILQGSLHIAAFKQAWQRVVERHSVLRTLFVWENRKKPLQIVRKRVELPWHEQDWRHLKASEQQAQLTNFLHEDKKQGFALNQAPLMRCTLIRLTEDTYQFVWSNHHLLIDGWCLPIIFKELFAYYEAISQDTELFMERPTPYQDYIVWLQQQDMAKAEQFWRRKLKGFLAPTSLRVEISSTVADKEKVILEQDMTLSPATTEALQMLARQHRLTLNTLVQGAWALLLSRYSGEDDVVFGATVSGRQIPLAGVESMVGLFINTLPVRVSIAKDIALIPWLQQLQLQQVDGEQYSYTPLVDIQSWSDVSPGTPLFENILVFENYPGDVSLQQVNRHLTISNVQSFGQTSYPLTLIGMQSQELSLLINYDTARFETATIVQMLGHLQTLLEGMVAHPEQHITELPLLTETEQHQLLQEWNTTAVDYPFDQCIHQLFEAQVEKTPEAVAVVFEDQKITYRELNQHANRLAHHLQSLAVKSDVLVGICMARSGEMVYGLLGILKAGGAYLPLDPAYPAARLAFMLEDAGAPVLLTQSSLVKELPSTTAQVVCLDTERDVFSQLNSSNPQSAVAPSNLAYVIYTSGSTGKPKGVAMEHGSLVNLIGWQLQNSTASYETKTLQFAPISFDVSFQEMFSTWCSGGELVLISEELRRDANALLKVLSEHKVERLFLPFVALQHFAEVANDCENLPLCLREIITAGEQLQITPDIAHWFQTLTDCTLYNHYGPSESHVVTAFTTKIPLSDWPVLPPIGCPIANTQIYILDRDRKPTPIGVPGELHIGGVALARGYLNRPELTEEKFIPNPFTNYSAHPKSEKSDRLYQTGDLARYLPDGNIEYLGRIDNQVKVRGFRIELGEIEALLAQHPNVRENVVIVQQEPPHGKRLIAGIIPNQAQSTDIGGELRRFLKEKLPDYMVPSAFVQLETIPLTPSGKIDRRALLRQLSSLGYLLSKETFVAPRTPVEELLASIWATVLGAEQVGIHDNFFELGGHSLLATQVMSRIREAFSCEFPLRHLFESPTVAELGEMIGTIRRDNDNLLAPPIKPIDREGNLPLSFAQERLWFLDQLTPNSPFYNVPIALRLTGSLNTAALEQSLAEIVHRHETLRTTFSTVAGAPIQVIHPFSVINYQLSIVNLQNLSPEEQAIEVPRLATLEAQQSFDLQRGPLFRTALLQLQVEESVLFLNHHHIVTDGWSINVLFREFSSLYKAFLTGAPSPLSPLPIQYVDFAHWQRQWLTGDVLETQLNYWQQQLATAPQVLDMPTDHLRPPEHTFRGGTEYFEITSECTQQLTSLSQQSGVTRFMISLAIFAILIGRYSGLDDIVIGSGIANRTRKEIEPLIGFFVNTLVLRIDLSGNPTFLELLKRVRQVTLEAYAHQDLPFEQLVEALQPERDMTRNPLVQIAFAFQNAPDSPPELSDLTLNLMEFDNDTVKFDLEFFLWEEKGQLNGGLCYYKDLFYADTIKRLLGHFQTLLTSIVTNPKQPIAEYALLNEAERHQLLVEWNHTEAVDSPIEQCIPQLFEAQVERTPNAIAVVFGNQQITYGELNLKANQLAHHLLSLGVKPEVLVGICLERSLEMVYGLLSILKAGGAYVPLDPTYPAARLAFMLEDAKVAVLLTRKHLVEVLPASAAQVICLDTDEKLISRSRSDNQESLVRPWNLAYVIYTSGTTGLPKGVMVEHRGLANLVKWQADIFQVTPQSRVTQFFSYNFDGAVGETFMALANGATLVMLTLEHVEPKKLIEAINYYGITIIVLVPSLLKELEPNLLQHSERLTVVSVGEICPVDLALKWHSTCHFRNAYGPTEYTVYSHIWTPSPTAVLTAFNRIPIGLPVYNTKTFILDAAQNPVPVGVAGEIYLSGVGIARGYLNRASTTFEKFIPNKLFLQDKFSEREQLTVESTQQKIAVFIEQRSFSNAQETHHAGSWQGGSPENILRLAEEVAPDLREAIQLFINQYSDDTVEYEGFCRYFQEGFQKSYASYGINQDILRILLPFEDFQGLRGIDFGFGTGEVMQTLTDMGTHIIGADLNPFFVQQVKEKGLEAIAAKIDVDLTTLLKDCNLVKESLDFALSTLVLDRVNNPKNLLTNIFGVLKLGGRFAIQTLLPIIPIEDGEIEEPITYTQEANRITPGLNVENDKLFLVSLLYELGGRDINLCQLPYVVDSRDGLQEYTIWSFFGQKSAQKAPILDSFYSRLYKTGDSACYRPDGQIEFFGRIDHQIKLRGFRIELDEIEAVLGQHPFLKENAVVVHETSTTDKRLVAYLVPSQGQVIENKELRHFLKERLPDYMIPSTFVTLEALPLTPNGKIDRRALLRLPVTGELLSAATFVAPRTSEEKQLADIWAKLLKLERVGIFDNFFEVGGHSLLAIQLLHRIRETFSIELPILYLFKSPTVAALAKHLEPILHSRAKKVPEKQELPLLIPIQTKGSKPPIFCVVPAHGDVFALEGVSKHLGEEQPFFILQAPLIEKGPPLKPQELAKRYLQEIRVIQTEGPYRLGGYCNGGTFVFEMAQQLQAQGEAVELLFLLETNFYISSLAKEFYKPLRKYVLKNIPPTDENSSRQERILNALFRDEGMRTHFYATLDYVPQPYPGRITFVQAEESEFKEANLPQEWQTVANGGFDLITTPGDHDSFVRSPNDQVLAQKLRDYIKQLDQPDSNSTG